MTFPIQNLSNIHIETSNPTPLRFFSASPTYTLLWKANECPKQSSTIKTYIIKKKTKSLGTAPFCKSNHGPHNHGCSCCFDCCISTLMDLQEKSQGRWRTAWWGLSHLCWSQSPDLSDFSDCGPGLEWSLKLLPSDMVWWTDVPTLHHTLTKAKTGVK